MDKRSNDASLARTRAQLAAFDSLPDPVVVVRASDQRIVDANRRFCEATGLSREAAMGKTSAQLGLWGGLEERQEFWERLLQEGEVRDHDFAFQPAGQEAQQGLLTSVLFREGGEDLVLSVFRDITPLRRAEEALQSRLKFEEVMTALSARFITLPPGEIDSCIEGGLAEIGGFLGGDLTGLLEVSPDGSQVWLSHRTPGESYPLPFAPGEDMARHFPWLRGWLVDQARVFCASSLDDFPPEAGADRASHARAGFTALLAIPIKLGGRVSHIVYVNHVVPREYPEGFIPRLQVLGEVFVNAMARRRAHEEEQRSRREIERLRDQLQAEADFLRREIETTHRHEEILGTSAVIQETIRLVNQVAPSDSHVLVTGETGTGKELVARAIHAASARRDRIMVTVNCAALPASLIESELFGREKGSYTGAMTRQIGRFEFADNGTIFLDEIGELPLELQGKLLRVLQQGDFERLGSPRTHKVNVRVIAATNRDLTEMARRGEFRKDLYFRLSVFPIEVPPLRQRPEDIPLIVWALVDEFSRKMGKKVDSISKTTMHALQGHPWPGNVRELRNTIERAMIQSHGRTLEVSLPRVSDGMHERLGSLEEVEKRHILRVLDETSGRIKGPDGAAERLGLKPSTLYSRMDRLGISRRP